jgi:hypothetical protein
MVLARLYDERLGKRDRAIEILSRYVNDKESESGADQDTAAALYNLACYESLNFGGSKEGSPSQKKALEYLRASFKRDAKNVQVAKQDPDLESIRALPDYAKLEQEFSAT